MRDLRMSDTTRSEWQWEGSSWHYDEPFICSVCDGPFLMIVRLQRGDERIQLCHNCEKLVEEGWLDLVLLVREVV